MSTLLSNSQMSTSSSILTTATTISTPAPLPILAASPAVQRSSRMKWNTFQLSFLTVSYFYSVFVVIVGGLTLLLSFLPLLLLQLGSFLSFSTAFASTYSAALSSASVFLGSASLTLTGVLTSSFNFIHGSVFIISIVYYTFATIYWVRKHGARPIPYHPSITSTSTNNSKIHRHVTHHALTLLCLLTSLLMQRDGQMILIGLWLGEVSNPPLIMEAMRSRMNLNLSYANPSNNHAHSNGSTSTGNNTSNNTTTSPVMSGNIPLFFNSAMNSNVDLALLHFLLFILTRFLALQFTAHVVFPLATLWTTKLCACLLLAVNSLFLLEYILKNSNRNGKRKRKNSNSSRNITNEWPM